MLKRTLAIAAILLTGCAPSAYKAPRISVVETHAMMSKPDAPVIADVRSKGAYWAGHIKGAINVPFDEVASGKVPWSKDKAAILYCA